MKEFAIVCFVAFGFTLLISGIFVLFGIGAALIVASLPLFLIAGILIRGLNNG